MKTIKVIATVNDVPTLYKKARTSAQRALLGYMAKTGVITSPIFCGAFNVLRSIEWCMEGDEIYSLYPMEDSVTVTEIINIAQSALDGNFDAFAFSAREVDNIVKYMGNK